MDKILKFILICILTVYLVIFIVMSFGAFYIVFQSLR